MGGGLAVCAKCGKPLVANSAVTVTGKHAALGCLSSVHGPSPYHPRVEHEVTRNGQKVTVMRDTGRVSVSHDLLESYVFEQAVARLNDIEYWHKRRSESPPRRGRSPTTSKLWWVRPTPPAPSGHGTPSRRNGRRGHLASVAPSSRC